MRLTFATALVASLWSAVPAPAAAADGCQVMLCLAGNWRAIGECVDPVRQVLRDMLKGKPFPTCSLVGGSGSTINVGLTRETCPPFYSRFNGESGAWEGCEFSGLIEVRSTGGTLWSEVFWNFGGETSTRYSAEAKAQLGAEIDPTYDRDAAAYTPPAPPPAPSWTGG